MAAPKIATCCYCGTRAALVLRGEGRHELACRGCGAPLHNLKALPVARESQPLPAPPARPGGLGKPRKQKAEKKKWRRRTLRRKVFAKALDVLDDIFD